MSSLARAKHPRMILGVVGTAIVVPVLGITISFVSVSANTQQDPSQQLNASAQQEATGAVANVSTPVASPAITNSPAEVDYPQPAQSPLPDPLAPEPSASNTPESEMTAEPKKTAEAETAAPTPTSEPKTTKIPQVDTVTQPVVTEQVVNEPKAVKKATETVGGWTAAVLNPGTVSLRAPQLSSGAKANVTVACSPSVNCVINGEQLTINEGTDVTVTYSAKATSTHTAWATTINN